VEKQHSCPLELDGKNSLALHILVKLYDEPIPRPTHGARLPASPEAPRHRAFPGQGVQRAQDGRAVSCRPRVRCLRRQRLGGAVLLGRRRPALCSMAKPEIPKPDANPNHSMNAHDHKCHCGAFDALHEHETGCPGCYRQMCAQPWPMENDWWIVEGQEITGTSLREQRLYHQHPCGCWSRSKEHGENSIEA